MKIVIDIPSRTYEKILSNEYDYGDMNIIIQNGKPLPKGHGRIIDESQIKHIVCHTERELYGDKIRYVKATDAPTIIEADRGE